MAKNVDEKEKRMMEREKEVRRRIEEPGRREDIKRREEETERWEDKVETRQPTLSAHLKIIRKGQSCLPVNNKIIVLVKYFR